MRLMFLVFLLSLVPQLVRAQEQEEVPAAEPIAALSIHVETLLPGTPEWVYDAITGDVSEWWDHRYTKEPHRFVLEPHPGGHFIEIFNEHGDGAVHANVIWAERGERMRFVGPLGFSGQPTEIVTTFDFTPVGADSTHLAVEVNAMGPMNAEQQSALRRVWRHFILDRFEPYVEELHTNKQGKE